MYWKILVLQRHRRWNSLALNSVDPEILAKMVENGWLRKEGASRSTIYVKNTENFE